LGYKYREEQRYSDVVLAKTTSGIDLIIGGHTHTFMEKADVLENRDGNKVIVNQVGCFGVNLGRVDFYLSPNGSKEAEGISITV
jgi:5'-nucleotidase